MNTNKIKSYAPQARQDFIQAVKDRANKLGLSEEHIEPVEFQGDVAEIGGQAFSKKQGELRQELESRIKRKGFYQFIEAMAYTWFNRFVALRYMEIHDYLGHGYRVLSNRSGQDVPEIVENAVEVDLPGLDNNEVVELKLAGDRDNELYRKLILAQCNALYDTIPFLFEKIDDATELMLPDNLLHTDSPVQKLVQALPEEEWQDVEIIGWIYQFYMSERKDQVIGKTVNSEDIPAATSLFTPNWIVRYMVHNTLGRMWLATYPDSSIREKMEFYIQPAEQDPEVRAELDRTTPQELNPEEITFMDPACGSGHILVEAYNLFREIYLELGYRTRDIPYYILQNNLYGLEIDDRSAQLAGFALLMKARQDNRRILERNNIKLNVQAIQEANGLEADYLARTLLRTRVRRLGQKQKQGYLVNPKEKQLNFEEREEPELSKGQLQVLLDLFQYAKTFGSLIQVPEGIWENIDAFERLVQKNKQGDLEQQKAVELLEPLVRQVRMLGEKYDCVVTNPPYMGNNGLNQILKWYAKNNYPDSKLDLFAMFIERTLDIAKSKRFVSLVTMQSWMFLSSFERLRYKLLDSETIISMAHLGARAFDSISGEVVQTTSFVLYNGHLNNYKGTYLRLLEAGSEEEKIEEFKGNPHILYTASASEFKKIPGSPIAYWVSDKIRDVFLNSETLVSNFDVKAGISTGKNNVFILTWPEVPFNQIKVSNSLTYKYTPHNKGGEFKKWMGNWDYVLKYSQSHIREMKKKPGFRHDGEDYYFLPHIGWSKITSSASSFRYYPEGFTFDSAGLALFSKDYKMLFNAMGILNSKVSSSLLKLMSPTLNVTPQILKKLPFIKLYKDITNIIDLLYHYTKLDWNSYETSWNFIIYPLLSPEHKTYYIFNSYTSVRAHWNKITFEMQRLEEENNRIFIEAYGLQDELTPDVPLEEITLTCNPYYRYGANKSEEELEALLRTDTMKELISYAIGCMMGRYSFDEPGLIYAHEGNVGFDSSKYQTFPADDDGIIPIMDENWFADDASNRLEEFISVAWPKEHLEENLKFIADSLSPKNNESPRETIRRYLSNKFFQDHLKMYKKRPIYWLFSSGKNKAFECLVYLHRYNETTLSRMRSDYVTPLMGKFSSRIEYLQKEIEVASTASVKNKLNKELNTLKKKQAELDKFDEELRHYADQRVSLDLDDGVKHNYGKFGYLLAEVKSITGKK